MLVCQMSNSCVGAGGSFKISLCTAPERKREDTTFTGEYGHFMMLIGSIHQEHITSLLLITSC